MCQMEDMGKEEPKGLRLVLGIDDKSKKVVEGLDCKPFYGSVRAVVTFKTKPPKKEGTGTTTEAKKPSTVGDTGNEGTDEGTQTGPDGRSSTEGDSN